MTEETTTEQLAEIEGQADPVQVREGRWRTRGGDIRNVTPTPSHDSRAKRWPWRDAEYDQTWTPNGRCQFDCEESPSDLVEYLGPIEQQPEPVPEPQSDTELQAQVAFLKGREVTLGTRLQQERDVTTKLRGDLELVQKLLGTERRRVTELEELVTSLRTINEGAEKAVSGAGVVNDSLRLQLAAVKAELVTQAETSRRLRFELDAAHQVPADSPELRQLRADLAEVTEDRDTYRDGYERVLSDLETIRETTKAETVETIVQWLEPVRATIEAADNVQQTMRADNLACDIIRNLPGILRYVVGLNHPEEIE